METQIADCCKDQTNLVLEEEHIDGRKMRRCKVCKRRHFEIEADMGVLGVEMNKQQDGTVLITVKNDGQILLEVKNIPRWALANVLKMACEIEAK